MTEGQKKKSPIVKTLYLLAIAAALLCALEAVLRAGLITPAFKQPTFDRPLKDTGGNLIYKRSAFSYGLDIVLDRRSLFKVKPYGAEGINGMGYRDREFPAERSDKRRILFLGDSFTMGLNVKPRFTIPKALERMLGNGHEVFNMGIHGYGPDQSLTRLLDEGLRLGPELVILALYPANDFNDLYKNALYRVEEGKLIENHPNLLEKTVPPLDSLYLFKYLAYKYGDIDGGFEELFFKLFHDGYDIDMLKEPSSDKSSRKENLMRGVLRRFKERLGAINAGFLVIIIPSYDNVQDDTFLKRAGVMEGRFSALEDLTASICENEGIPYLNLYREFRSRSGLYDPANLHLSAYGNSLAARAIRGQMAESGLITPDK